MPNPPMGPSTAAIDPARWLNEHGDSLFRYALARVRRSDVAEDLVQETFLSALRNQAAFARNSSERTWLVGILKHKIVDHLRRQFRETPTASLADDECLKRLFDGTGHWNGNPAKWTNPAAALEDAEFWTILSRCIERLPESLAGVFVLRALDDIPSADVCAVLGISAANLHVILHRARLQLWRCLNVHWFDGTRGLP